MEYPNSTLHLRVLDAENIRVHIWEQNPSKILGWVALTMHSLYQYHAKEGSKSTLIGHYEVKCFFLSLTSRPKSEKRIYGDDLDEWKNRPWRWQYTTSIAINKRNNVTRNNITRNNITRNNIARNNITRNNIARNNITRNNIARNNITRNNIARNNIARNNITRNNIIRNATHLIAPCRSKPIHEDIWSVMIQYVHLSM